MNSLKRYLNEKWIGLSITLSSILIISILHLIGIFDVLELKTYDYEDESVLHNKREKKKFKIETYNDEIVRSKEECEIANFTNSVYYLRYLQVSGFPLFWK